MARRLPTYESTIAGAHEHVPFGAALAMAIAHELARLRQRLAAIGSPADEKNVHRARIVGKRLRYLLEIVEGTGHAPARESVRQLKGLQDILGGIHDSHVIAATIADALVDAAAQQALRLHASVQVRPPGRSASAKRPGGSASWSPRARSAHEGPADASSRAWRRSGATERRGARRPGAGGHLFARGAREAGSSASGPTCSPPRPAAGSAPRVDIAQDGCPASSSPSTSGAERAADGEQLARLDVMPGGAPSGTARRDSA
jgi:hypothetical protein